MATTTRRYLVIANQTLAEAELTEAIRQRLEQGPSSFYLLVPDTAHGDLAAHSTSRNGSGWTSPTGCTATPGCQ